MRTFNFTFLAVFSCIAMTGATPLRAEAIGRRHQYDIAAVEVLTRLKKSFSSLDCNEHPDAPACLDCDADPFQPICDDLCFVNREVSFCSRICRVNPDLAFCNSD
jgi:hypothetical protein